MAFFIHPTHISILPHTSVLRVTGTLDPFFIVDEKASGVGVEYVRVLEESETETTIYDGILE